MQLVARDTLLTYPDSNEEFKIHYNANYLHLGAVIVQKGKKISFYCIKLHESTKHYTVTEREILRIIETLNEFRRILLDKRLEIYTDQKKITCKNFNYDRVLG